MAEKPKYATQLFYKNPDTQFTALVVHDCTCLDFMKDIQAEIDRLLKEGITGKVDIFWRLGTYCRAKYGECYWNHFSVDALQHVDLGPNAEGITAWSVAAKLKKEAEDAKHQLDKIARFVESNKRMGKGDKKIILDITERETKT